MTASAAFQISVAGGAYGAANTAANASPTDVITCRLVSTSGVDPSTIVWTNFGTHDPSQAALVPVLSGSPTGQIATFTLPATATGQAYGISCTVNGGASVTGIAATTAKSAVYCLNNAGQRPFFIGEQFESSATHGVVPRLNAASAYGGLVTQTAGGALNAWGAATANLYPVSDGATAGCVWRSYLSLGATPTAAGNMRLTNGFLARCTDGAGHDHDVLGSNAGTIQLGANDANVVGVHINCGTGGEINITGGGATTEIAVGDSYVAIAADSHEVSRFIHNGAQVGNFAVAEWQYSTAQASGRHAASGDCQRSVVTVGRASDQAGSVELTLTNGAPGAGTRVTIAADKCYRFTLDISCICVSGGDAGACAGWHAQGMIKNIGGTTALVGNVFNLLNTPTWSAVSWVPCWADAALAAATIAVAADDPNDCIAVTCTGVASGGVANHFHWTGSLELVEVG